MDYQRELEFIKAAAVSCFDKMSGIEIEVTSKGDFDRVTNLDTDMEKLLLEKIAAAFPGDKIISEEFNPSAELSDGRTWVIDPIDGTVNMSHDILLYGVQAALLEHGEPVVSVVYLPHLNEVYTAVKGGGAYLNGKRIYAAKRPLNECMVSIGDFVHKRDGDAEIQLAFVKNIRKSISKVRLFGAASVDFAFAASGRTDSFLMFTKNLWDIAPGLLLVKEAGCKVYNARGEEYKFFDQGILSTANEEIPAFLPKEGEY